MLVVPDIRDGIPISNHGVRIPWLISLEDLYQLIPESDFERASNGGFPMLRFDLLGFEAQFWFNFVSHSDGKLTEVQFWNEKPKARNRTYRKAAAALKTSMGKPNVVDMSRWGQQTWRFGDLKVSNYISKWRQPREGRKGIAHTLSFSINHEAWQERSPSLANSSE